MSAGDDIFSRPGPRWYTIPAGRCFLDDLALGLCRSLDGHLADAIILTPTRRGARAMARAFSHQARGRPLLLPQVRAVGDLDEGEPPFDLDALALDLPPALSSVRRRFELARLVTERYEGVSGARGKLALDLADSLAAFFDSLALEEIDASDKLDRLVLGEGDAQYSLEGWAEHWQISAKFLRIAVVAWPARLKALGAMDPSQRQVALIRRLVDQWRDRPPATPLVMAGTTGSAPSTADLVQVVANAPMGATILPGLDLSLAGNAWAQIEDSHPQNTLKRLLDRHNVTRDVVKVWPVSLDSNRKAEARRRLLNEALRPAEATRDWRTQIGILKQEGPTTIEDGLEGLYEIDTARDEEAASVVALLMREALETPDKTVALVTPDLSLSRRVSARLTRWGLIADSSAGEPLLSSLTGRFLHDLLGLVLEPHDPVLLLSLWRNPLCRFYDVTAMIEIERCALRGARPNDLGTITAMLHADERVSEDAIAQWREYVDAIRPMLDQPFTDLGASLTLFSIVAQSLSANADALWAGAAGASASELLAELMREGAGYAIDSPREFAEILNGILQQTKVRTGGNNHPRLQVLGAIEARLIKADRIILAGLEEGVWPQVPDNDPFLSRPMRKTLGLPTPERRTGLSAHDFVQTAAAPEVYLVTRRRREGEPQVQSRWLWRLKTLCEGAGVPSLPTRPEVLDWARALDCGLPDKPATLRPAKRPEPRPPVDVRPDSLSVTEVEVFVRDPYAIYARRILKVKPLDRPNEPVEARQRGTAIHKSLERFVTENAPLGQAGVETLNRLLEEELAGTHMSPAEIALQRPLIPHMAEAFVAFEARRRDRHPRLVIESRGEIRFPVAGREFALIAKSDRLEVRDDHVDILDFKTGYPASLKQVLAGFYPQLTLTGAILRHGGFEGIRGKSVGDMIYIRVAPDDVSERYVQEKGVPNDDLAEKALTSLRRRLDAYAKPNKAYLSWTAPQFLKNRGGDYDQLARLYEWYVLGDDETAEPEADGAHDG
jgi:ATP-dependent helicase/nuclease subunit B